MKLSDASTSPFSLTTETFQWPSQVGSRFFDDQIRELMRQMAYEDAQVQLEKDRSADFSFEMPQTARFRVNAFYERGRLAMALRVIPVEVPPFDS